MTALAKIHIAKKQLGLDDDTYRAVLVRVTGKSSSAKMSAAEQLRVLDEFKRLGFRPASKAPQKGGKAPRRQLTGPYAKKLQALWIAGHNLGLIRDRSDQALLAFVERQTGIAATEWLRSAADAKKAVEALKAWLARDGGVRWETDKDTPEWAARHGFQIAKAQHTRLHGRWNAGIFWLDVYRMLGRPSLGAKPTDAEWIEVMNKLGEQLRAAGGKAVAA